MPVIIQVPLSRLKYFRSLGIAPEPNGQVDAMAADIKSKGIREPLIVRPVGDLYEVVCGLVRWKGAIVSGLETVPAEVRQLTDAQALALSVLDNMRPIDDRDVIQPKTIVEPSPIIDVVRYTSTAPYKIDEPLGTGFCKLLANDFGLEDVQTLMRDSTVDSTNLEADLSMFWAGLSEGRLHIEGRGDDCGQFILAYIEAYFDVEEPHAVFSGPSAGIWTSLSDSERDQVVADATRLNPIVNSTLSAIFQFSSKADRA